MYLEKQSLPHEGGRGKLRVPLILYIRRVCGGWGGGGLLFFEVEFCCGSAGRLVGFGTRARKKKEVLAR